jgi:hypothetical protein
MSLHKIWSKDDYVLIKLGEYINNESGITLERKQIKVSSTQQTWSQTVIKNLGSDADGIWPWVTSGVLPAYFVLQYMSNNYFLNKIYF